MAIITWTEATDGLSHDFYVKRYTINAAALTGGDQTAWLPLPRSCSIRWSILCNADYLTTTDATITTPNLFILGSNADVLTAAQSGIVMGNPTFASRNFQPDALGGFVYTFTGEILTPHSYFAINFRGTPLASFVVPTVTVHSKVGG